MAQGDGGHGINHGIGGGIGGHGGDSVFEYDGGGRGGAACGGVGVMGAGVVEAVAHLRSRASARGTLALLDALRVELFSKLGFRGARDDEYGELDNSFIDRVRESSPPTTHTHTLKA